MYPDSNWAFFLETMAVGAWIGDNSHMGLSVRVCGGYTSTGAISLTLICPPKETGLAVQRDLVDSLKWFWGNRGVPEPSIAHAWEGGGTLALLWVWASQRWVCLHSAPQTPEVSHGVGSYSLGQG